MHRSSQILVRFEQVKAPGQKSVGRQNLLGAARPAAFLVGPPNP